LILVAAANYSDGTFFHYTYDEVGNRLSMTTQLGTVNYVYDDANRLASVGGVSYTWDNNGNLLSDGTSTYSYDHANRLKSVVQGSNTYTYSYNGMGNRVSQTLNAGTPTVYVLDQAAGLVQVLSDGSYTYLYGNDRLAQQSTSATEYFLTDALGSVRQLTNSDGEITLNRSYDPYGNVLASSGDGESVFAFTGEQVDSYSGLLNLRSRMYSLSIGRFMSRDTWPGDLNQPISYNAWLYGNSNPIKYVDSSGNVPICPFMGWLDCLSFFGAIPDYKGLAIVELNKTAFDQAGPEIEAKGLHKTTIAAAIAVQSQWLNYPADTIKGWAYQIRYLGCQYSFLQKALESTGASRVINKILVGAGVGYAKSGEFDKYGNLYIMSNSIAAMTDRIKNVVDLCKYSSYQCNPKDKLIVDSMAQNTAFGDDDIEGLVYDTYHQGYISGNHLNINWADYFSQMKLLSETHPGNLYALFNDIRAEGRKNYNTRFMLQLFTQDMKALNFVFGWELPPGIGVQDLDSMMSLALQGK
jgi:RHS repeat-associated protein